MKLKDFIIITLVVTISSMVTSYSPEIIFVSAFLALIPIIALGLIKGLALFKTAFFDKNNILKILGLSLLEAFLGSIIGWNFGNPRRVCFDTCAQVKDPGFMGDAMRGLFFFGLIFALFLNTCALIFVKLLMRRAAKKAKKKS